MGESNSINPENSGGNLNQYFIKENFIKSFKVILLALLIFSPLIFFFGFMFFYQQTYPEEKTPFVQFSGLNPSNEAIVTWETKIKENSVVWYGISDESLNLKRVSQEEATLHQVILIGLKPDTKYYYRVGSNKQNMIYRSSIFSFKTAPKYKKDFQFIAYSDSQQIVGIGWHNRICNAISKQEDISFAANVGDLCQNWDYKPDWNQFFFEASSYMKKNSFVPCLGNHDGYYPKEETEQRIHYYKQYFGSPEKDDRFFYSFEWGDSLFVIGEISTTSDEDPSKLRNIQHDLWLNNTLADGQDKTYRILMFHRQLFSAEKDNQRLISRIIPIVEKYNVSLVLYGHHHHYERFLYKGHTYICLGGGGGQQFGSNYYRTSNYTKCFAMGPSYTKVAIQSNKINIITYTPEDNIIDNFSLILRENNAVLVENN